MGGLAPTTKKGKKKIEERQKVFEDPLQQLDREVRQRWQQRELRKGIEGQIRWGMPSEAFELNDLSSIGTGLQTALMGKDFGPEWRMAAIPSLGKGALLKGAKGIDARGLSRVGTTRNIAKKAKKVKDLQKKIDKDIMNLQKVLRSGKMKGRWIRDESGNPIPFR